MATNCKICQSEHCQAINQLFKDNATIEDIILWCKDKGFKVSQTTIKNHGNHTNLKPRQYVNKQHDIIANSSDIEYFTGINASTFRQWVYEKKVIISEDARLSEIIKAIIVYLQTTKNIDKSTLLEEKRLLTIEQRKKLELENQVRIGELIEIEEIKKIWSKVASKVKNNLLGLPTKLALQLSAINNPLEIEKIIKDEIYQVLSELKED